MVSYLVILFVKGHDTVVVMDNKHFITLVSVHIAVIALVGCVHSPLARENTMPTRSITHDIAR